MTQIQIRRDTAANWASANPTLASGEPAFETDTGKFKIGDGVTAYNSLPYKGETGVDDYEDLTSKPQINSITLEGNKTATELGLADAADIEELGNEVNTLAGDVSDLETSKQNIFTVQKPIYLDKKQESDKVGWGYEAPYLVPQNEINLTNHVSPTYIQYNTDSTNKMPSNYILFPLYEQDTDPASAIIKIPFAASNNNYEKLFFGKYVDGYFVPLCYFAYQSFSGTSIRCRPYAIGGTDYTNPSVTSVSTSGSVATINIEGTKSFQQSSRDLQVQGGWGNQSHSSITSQPLDNLFEFYWPYGGNMYGMAINLNRNTDNGTVTRIGCTYTNGTTTYMITSTDTDLCELLSEATFALYCFDVSTPTAVNNKDHNLFGYYKYSDTGATTMPWLLTGQGIDEFWTNVLQHNSFTTGAEILENNNLRLGVDNNTIKVNDDGNLYANISAPTNMVTTDTAQTITGTKTFNKIILPDTNFSDGIYLGDNTSPSIYGYNGALSFSGIATLSTQALTLNAEDSILKVGNWTNGTQFTLQLQGINSSTGSTALYTILRARNNLKRIELGNENFTVVDYNGNPYLTSISNIAPNKVIYNDGSADYTLLNVDTEQTSCDVGISKTGYYVNMLSATPLQRNHTETIYDSSLNGTIGNLAMPNVSAFTDNTLPATGTSTTATEAGYLYINKVGVNVGEYIQVTVKDTSGNVVYADDKYAVVANQALKLTVPIPKGCQYTVDYTATGTTNAYRFIKTVGQDT